MAAMIMDPFKSGVAKGLHRSDPAGDSALPEAASETRNSRLRNEFCIDIGRRSAYTMDEAIVSEATQFLRLVILQERYTVTESAQFLRLVRLQ